MLKEYRTLLPYIKKHLPFYILGFIFLVITDAGQLLIPQFLKNGIDTLFLEGDKLPIIGMLMLKMVITAGLVGISRFLWRYFIHGASMRIERELRDDFFSHLLILSSSFYQKNKTGDLMARATNDLKSVRMACGMGLVALTDGLFMTLAILTILFINYPRLSAYAILPLPVLTFLIIRFGPLLGKRFKKMQEDYSNLSDKAQEAFSGIRVIKSFVKERYFLSGFDDANREYQKSTMKLVKFWGVFFPAIGFLAGLTVLILLYFGGRSVMDGKISAGDFVALLSYLDMLIWPMMGAGFVVNFIQRGGASLGRLNEVFKDQPDIESNPGAPEINDFKELSFRGLTFSYNGTDSPVLKDLNLSLVKGQTLGILGRTGSGKTTLLKLLPRLIDPPPGTVFINGGDVRDWELSSLRGLFAFVPQDTFLFSASIRDNILFGNPELGEEAMLAGAELSTIARDVSDFPNSWNTQVGEKGVTLSGGQKQRIAISRAVILDSPVLVFDDALSAVDTETEKLILTGFFKRRTGRTNILVSHRISTLELADYVVVLDRGEIVQKGTPSELLAQEGIYQEIALLQSMELKEGAG